MNVRHTLLGFLAVGILTGGAHAQMVQLAEAPLAKECVRNELTMEFDGKITVKQDGKDVVFPHKAQARHVFSERFLEVNGTVGDKAARHYTAAESTISFNNDAGTKQTLRKERSFLVAQRLKDHVVSFSPHGALTRQEMELTEHLDTMAVSGLLPGKEIAVGQTWTIANHVITALCDFDGLATQNLEGKLESVRENQANVTITGTASGINLGAQVKMLINARLAFDVKAQRIVQLDWQETDERQQGPITPALAAEVKVKLTRKPIDTPEELSDFALVKIPTTKLPPAELSNIVHKDANSRFTLNYARDWHVVSPEDSPQLVLRALERGNFLGQATITMWKKTDPKKVMPLDEFADLMARTPGWMEEKEIERKQLDNLPKGQHTVYRVAASGELDGARTVQYFYLIVGARGEQLIVTFSVVPQQVQQLGARDLELIREIMFPE